VCVEFGGQPSPALVELSAEGSGYFSGLAADAASGVTYGLRLDNSPTLWPDPASRFQPAGPRGVSQVVDPNRYPWRDVDWPGVSTLNRVVYEMHIGTFTPEGTWAAARDQLAELASLGITVLEIMPIAEFSGDFGWGYDGANLFAPYRTYGEPDELRRFVDEAHRVGLGVILDVVYNHLSRVGEQLLRPFSDAYVSRRDKNDWGAAINFDGDQSASVREYFLANVRHWISEYHFDGLRIDATQAFNDRSDEHILLALCRAARRAAPERRVWIVGENEPQRASLLRSTDEGGYEFDALWNDDFHHAAMVRLTGRREAYYTDYQGSAEEFVAAAQWGFLFQGQRYSWQNNPRGTAALDLAAPRFIHYLQNHDQLANSARGARIHELTSPGRYRAMTALLLVAPQTPHLFQGQEFAATSPFLYFNDCTPDEAEGVRRGRAKFLAQFPSLAGAQMQANLPDPCDAASFRRSKLDLSERGRHAGTYALHRDLLRLRRDDPVLADHNAVRVHGATLGPDAFLLRFLAASGQTRLLLVNFGCDLRLASVSQPLIAPPEVAHWATLWSSEDPRYGGSGTPDLDTSQGWRIPGEAAVLLHPVRGRLTP
jgi:maltooligosyltrehalose trehalohydrolase